MLDKQDFEIIQAMMLSTFENVLIPIHERLDKLERKIDTLDGRVGTLEGKIDTLDGRVGTLEGKIDTLDGRVGTLEEKISNLEEESRQTRILVEAQHHNIGLLCDAQVETAAKFSQLDQMQQTLGEVKSEIQVISDVVQFHSGIINEIPKAL